jgi:glycosyltransferase involved in cell wall biosynthesis
VTRQLLERERTEQAGAGGGHRTACPITPVTGVRSPKSLGVVHYVEGLALALGELGVDYRPAARPSAGLGVHLHLANSSRTVLRHAAGMRAPYVVTVHDVMPRTPALRPWYSRAAYPLLRRAAATIVHSEFAATLVAGLGAGPRRLEVIPHPARTFASLDQQAARQTLGWESDRPLFVLPGVLKPAKLVAETLAAAAPLLERGTLRLALVGPVVDERLTRRARSLGALLLPSPARRLYEQAIVAADCVLVLRDASVGETNGPLMDALGAGRAVLATAVGSITEIAEDAAHYCLPTAESIHAGLETLCDDDERGRHAEIARARAEAFSLRSVAERHADLFGEVLGG